MISLLESAINQVKSLPESEQERIALLIIKEVSPEIECQKSLLDFLSTVEPLDEDFPDVDEGLLPLDDIDL